jgi:hypothetical protein
VSKQTRKLIYNFRGAQAPPLTASRDGGIWTKADTSAAGSPTVQAGNDGMELTLSNTNEVQNICFYMGDVLPFDIDDLIAVEFLAKVTASLPATVTAIFGLGSARNDTPDSVAANAWFRLQGSNALLVESDDGTTDQDDKATGVSLSTTFRRCRIDLAQAVFSQDAPSLSKGGKAHTQFFVSNDTGSLRRVAAGTRFDLSAYTGNLQLMAQLQKTAAADVATLTLLEAMVEYRLPA